MRPRRTLAVFTLVRDEEIFLPLWISHYRKQVPISDIFVIDNDTCDGSTDNLPVRVLPASNGGVLDHSFHVTTVMDMQHRLLEQYQYVLFTDCDELLCVNPHRYRSLADYVLEKQPLVARVRCHEPVQAVGEAPVDWSLPILAQRTRWMIDVVNGMSMNKPLLASVPVRWCAGFHHLLGQEEQAPDPDLMLIHLHRVDYEYTRTRHLKRLQYNWSEESLAKGLGWHNRIGGGEEFDNWYYRDIHEWESIHEDFRRLL